MDYYQYNKVHSVHQGALSYLSYPSGLHIHTLKIFNSVPNHNKHACSITPLTASIVIMEFHCIYFIIYNALMIETNSQISVYEQGEWIDKGWYTAAVKFNEDVEWIKEKRDYILPVCYVRYLYSIQVN